MIIIKCNYYKLFPAFSEDDKLPNLDVTATTSDEQVVPVRERKHFHSNVNKTGYIIFSVS